MIVFIGMETSGALRRRFQAAGFETYSCDTLPSEDGGEETVYSEDSLPLGRHMVGDVFDCLDNMAATDLWPDLAIFHPTCTYHAVSGAWAFGDGPYHQKVKPETLVGAARREARSLAEADVERIKALPIKRKIMENPRGTIPTRTSLGKPTQIIQPYQFGDDASKATCLWIWGMGPVPIDPYLFVAPRMVCKRCGGIMQYDAAHKDGCGFCGAEPGLLLPRWSNQTDSNQNRLSPGPDRWKERSRTWPGIADAVVEHCVSALRGEQLGLI